VAAEVFEVENCVDAGEADGLRGRPGFRRVEWVDQGRDVGPMVRVQRGEARDTDVSIEPRNTTCQAHRLATPVPPTPHATNNPDPLQSPSTDLSRYQLCIIIRR